MIFLKDIPVKRNEKNSVYCASSWLFIEQLVYDLGSKPGTYEFDMSVLAKAGIRVMGFDKSKKLCPPLVDGMFEFTTIPPTAAEVVLVFDSEHDEMIFRLKYL